MVLNCYLHDILLNSRTFASLEETEACSHDGIGDLVAFSTLWLQIICCADPTHRLMSHGSGPELKLVYSILTVTFAQGTP